MRRLLAALLLAAWPAAAQVKITTAPCKITDGSCGTPTFATMTAPSGCVATSVPIFLGSPVALGCDAGLTYDAGADTLTSGGLRVAPGAAAAPSIGSTASPTSGIFFTGSATLFAAGSNVRHAFNYNGAGEVALRSDANVVWSSTTSAIGAPDSGLRRVSPGLVGVTDGSTGNGAIQAAGFKVITGSRPTADAASAGMIWYVAGGTGVADTLEVCVKSGADTYSWVSLF